MEMRSWLWTSLLAFGLTVGRAFAQDAVRPAPSASDVRVVRVRVVRTVGMCGGYGHCTAMTTIGPSFIIRESKDSEDKQKFPDRRTKRAITKQDWESLLRATDKESLKAIPQPTGCRSCIDLPDTWLEVNLSDGTHISVSFAPENLPAPVATDRDNRCKIKAPIDGSLPNSTIPFRDCAHDDASRRVSSAFPGTSV